MFRPVLFRTLFVDGPMRVYITMDIIFLVSYHIRTPLPPVIFLFIMAILFRSHFSLGAPLYICTYSYSSFFAVEAQIYMFLSPSVPGYYQFLSFQAKSQVFNSELVPNSTMLRASGARLY
ncbi:uncharacterized protein BJ212DRAFT_840549 [Suillus subaureus]|uniref:Uncharacterized protein n=1 Tax=Suillus subaureus TaxID=48587 RepID=A0A9P7JHL9_9AGAM|nr:uncharacterized protein BJ212DRAFT_840549 [Suillus subaureus]KAG1822957.1 hypothetical protein BJ212DRAFT_840549 [Suillus subaureus]